MAGIEITDEMTVEQLEAMTGGEQLKAEVRHTFVKIFIILLNKQSTLIHLSHSYECLYVSLLKIRAATTFQVWKVLEVRLRYYLKLI